MLFKVNPFGIGSHPHRRFMIANKIGVDELILEGCSICGCDFEMKLCKVWRYELLFLQLVFVERERSETPSSELIAFKIVKLFFPSKHSDPINKVALDAGERKYLNARNIPLYFNVL